MAADIQIVFAENTDRKALLQGAAVAHARLLDIAANYAGMSNAQKAVAVQDLANIVDRLGQVVVKMAKTLD